MVDLDDFSTYPEEIRDWVLKNGEWFKQTISRETAKGRRIEKIIEDMKLAHESFVLDFIHRNACMEVCVWHATRIEDEKQFFDNGLLIIGAENPRRRYCDLFRRIGLQEADMKPIFKEMEKLWRRCEVTRVKAIHFFAQKSLSEDLQMSYFAVNIGGEVLRWALESVDKDLHKAEPYKRLWILGKPCIIKFKCKLGDMYELSRIRVVIELVKYFVITELYASTYEIECDGFCTVSIPPENIVTIEEMKNFIETQEAYGYKGFYDELKK